MKNETKEKESEERGTSELTRFVSGTGRGSGRTAKQIFNAAEKAVYIWVNGYLDYPRGLAKELNRDDIEFVRPSWLTLNKWRGRKFSEIILDHACELSDEQWDKYYAAKLNEYH